MSYFYVDDRPTVKPTTWLKEGSAILVVWREEEGRMVAFITGILPTIEWYGEGRTPNTGYGDIVQVIRDQTTGELCGKPYANCTPVPAPGATYPIEVTWLCDKHRGVIAFVENDRVTPHYSGDIESAFADRAENFTETPAHGQTSMVYISWVTFPGGELHGYAVKAKV